MRRVGARTDPPPHAHAPSYLATLPLTSHPVPLGSLRDHRTYPWSCPPDRYMRPPCPGPVPPPQDVYVVPNKTIAFVRFHLRASAKFAKEAMSNQQLRGSSTSEVLNIKWANDDPNPVAVQRYARHGFSTPPGPPYRHLGISCQHVVPPPPHPGRRLSVNGRRPWST